MKIKIINALKLFIMMLAMTLGFQFMYMAVWHAVAELTAGSVITCAVVAILTEFAYIWWVKE